MEGHSGPSPMTASISECVCLGIGPIMSSWSSDWVTSCIKAYVHDIFNVREYVALILASLISSSYWRLGYMHKQDIISCGT